MRFRLLTICAFGLVACQEGSVFSEDAEVRKMRMAEDSYLQYLTCSDIIGSHYHLELNETVSSSAELAISTCADEARAYAVSVKEANTDLDVSMSELVQRIERRMATKIKSALSGANNE